MGHDLSTMEGRHRFANDDSLTIDERREQLRTIYDQYPGEVAGFMEMFAMMEDADRYGPGGERLELVEEEDDEE